MSFGGRVTALSLVASSSLLVGRHSGAPRKSPRPPQIVGPLVGPGLSEPSRKSLACLRAPVPLLDRPEHKVLSFRILLFGEHGPTLSTRSAFPQLHNDVTTEGNDAARGCR